MRCELDPMDTGIGKANVDPGIGATSGRGARGVGLRGESARSKDRGGGPKAARVSA